MYFIYCDEQDNHQLRYSAAIACIFQVEQAREFRKFVISGLRRIFNRAPTNASPFPILHASALPDELSDEQKVDLFELLLRGVSKHSSGVVRIGYHWDDENISNFMNANSPQIAARLSSFTHLKHAISQYQISPIAFVQEHDKSTYDLFSEILNPTTNLEQRAQISSLQNQDEILFEHILGYYYSPKKDYLTYAADFVGYLFKITEEEHPSNFKRCLLARSKNIVDLPILENRIVPLRPLGG